MVSSDDQPSDSGDELPLDTSDQRSHDTVGDEYADSDTSDEEVGVCSISTLAMQYLFFS